MVLLVRDGLSNVVACCDERGGLFLRKGDVVVGYYKDMGEGMGEAEEEVQEANFRRISLLLVVCM